MYWKQDVMLWALYEIFQIPIVEISTIIEKVKKFAQFIRSGSMT